MWAKFRIMTTNDNYTKRGHVLMTWLCSLFLIAVTGCEEATTTRSLSEQEYHYDGSLSMLSVDRDGYWIGAETGIVWHVKGQDKTCYYTGLDRIYDIERNLQNTNQIWIAARNAGLQLWNIAQDSLVHQATFTLPNKGDEYSPYDIEQVKGTIYLATSQGLYSTTASNATKELTPIYPKSSKKTEQGVTPFVVNNLSHAGGRWLFAATQAGIAALDLYNNKVEVRHQGEYIRHLEVYDNRLYALANGKLLVERLDGQHEEQHAIPQAVLSFYKVGRIYYFITSSSVLLSDDLKRFISAPLHHEIPTNAHEMAIPNDGKGFSVLLGKSEVWRIPHHLGIFTANASIAAACKTGDKRLYLNDKRELFRQQGNEKEATKIYDFKEGEQPMEMQAFGDDVYYRNVNNQLCRLTADKNYLLNQVFARPKVLMQTKTRITAMALQPTKRKVLLGVQDYLLAIDMETGKVDTVKSMNGKYITSFYQPSSAGDKIYITTLNHGVFVGNGEAFSPIKNTTNKSFINGIITCSKRPNRITLLTNHQLEILGSDSLQTDGCTRMYCINDSILYTISEAGIHKYAIRQGQKLVDCGTFYNDIHFNAQAGFVQGQSLYIGSDLGVMALQVGKETSAQWVTFNDKVPNPRLVLLVLLAVLVVIGMIIFVYIKQKRAEKMQLQLGKDDLHRRLSTLTSIRNRLSDGEQKDIDNIYQEIEQIGNDSQDLKAASRQFSSVSARISRINQDTALYMMKYLNDQIKRIQVVNIYESNIILKASEEARLSNDIEIIIRQCEKNEMWLREIEDLEEQLHELRRSTEGTLILKGLNDGMKEEISRISERYQQVPIAEVHDDFAAIKAQYERIFSTEGLSIIQQYIDQNIAYLEREEDYQHVTKALITELKTIKDELTERDRIEVLRTLQIIDYRIVQVKQLKALQRLMQHYITVHDDIVHENESRRMKKFDSKLFADIDSATRDITDRIKALSSFFFDSMMKTDESMCGDLFHFTSANSQQVRVLILLLAIPKVKRTLLPGMLGIYGNLNPVVSRLYHSKIGDNRKALIDYCKAHPSSIVHYILKLSE